MSDLDDKLEDDVRDNIQRKERIDLQSMSSTDMKGLWTFEGNRLGMVHEKEGGTDSAVNLGDCHKNVTDTNSAFHGEVTDLYSVPLNTNNNAKVANSRADQAEEALEVINISNDSVPNDTVGKEKIKIHPNDKIKHADDAVWSISKEINNDEKGNMTQRELDEYRKNEQGLRDKEPLLFCAWIAEKPGLFFGLTLACHILLLMITAALFVRGYNILPITFDQLPLDIRDDTDYLRGLAWSNRDDDSSIITRGSSSSTNQSERSETAELLEMIFYKEGGNVFTQENLRLMKQVEQEFYTNPTFQQSFCLLDNNNTCTKPRSVLRYFDGTYRTSDPATAIFDDPDFNQVQAVLYAVSINNATKTGLQYHLGKEAVINQTHAVSDITRGYLLVGMPLAGYVNSSDNKEEQENKIKKFMLEEMKTKAEGYFQSGVGTMKFVYNSPTLLSLTITTQVITDMALALGSLVFIVLFVCIQTGSLWVGLFAIFSVMVSFNEANLFYRVILDFRYFGVFHVLAVFIILGIGADDVFVFFDTWKESAHHHYKSLAHRLSDCYRKAALAMLFTSVTTAVAFAVSAGSPFLGISSFGVFSCVLVIVNYISVVVFFPTVVVCYHCWWEKYQCCCCCPRTPVTIINKNHTTTISEEKPKNLIVRFFVGPYYRFITHKILRVIIIIFFLALIAVSVYFACQLKVNEEQVEFLPSNSNFGQYLSLRSAAFASTSETGSQVILAWGLQPQSLSSCHKTDASCVGTTTWDDTFDLNSEEAQRALQELCTDLRSLSKEQTAALTIRRSLVDDVPEVDCFVKEMETFYLAEDSRVFAPPQAPYPANATFTYPLDASEVQTIMNTNTFIYDVSKLPAGFNRYFEVATSFWLYNGFRTGVNGFDLGSNLRTYGSYIGEANDGDAVEKTFGTRFSYMYGTRLRYVGISINLTIEASNLGFPRGLPIRTAWEEFTTQKMAAMPTSLGGGFQVSRSGSGLNVWHWLKVQQTLASTALLGIAIGICVALPILVVATQNVFVGLLATLTICCITCSVIAVIPLAGWKLGVLESLNLVLVVGLAVDYVVHLAEGYSRSIYKDRGGRTRSALEEVGVSVLSGAVTTLGASAFLFGAFIIFFTQFGIFMFSTIGFSILYSLGLFMTTMALIGPENDVGSLQPLWRWCSARCCRGKEVAPSDKQKTVPDDSKC